MLPAQAQAGVLGTALRLGGGVVACLALYEGGAAEAFAALTPGADGEAWGFLLAGWLVWTAIAIPATDDSPLPPPAESAAGAAASVPVSNDDATLFPADASAPWRKDAAEENLPISGIHQERSQKQARLPPEGGGGVDEAGLTKKETFADRGVPRETDVVPMPSIPPAPLRRERGNGGAVIGATELQHAHRLKPVLVNWARTWAIAAGWTIAGLGWLAALSMRLYPTATGALVRGFLLAWAFAALACAWRRRWAALWIPALLAGGLVGPILWHLVAATAMQSGADYTAPAAWLLGCPWAAAADALAVGAGRPGLSVADGLPLWLAATILYAVLELGGRLWNRMSLARAGP